jgi:RHS repeat-associated protein
LQQFSAQYGGFNPWPQWLTYLRGTTVETTTGCCLSRDPLGLDGGDPNLYRYVGNNPVNRVVQQA